VTDKTIVIPGHGAVGGKADLMLFQDVSVEIREKVAALKKRLAAHCHRSRTVITLPYFGAATRCIPGAS
jgi:hypothetical protein